MTQSNSAKKRKTTRSTTKKTVNTAKRQPNRQDQELWYEVGLIILFAFMVFLFLCNLGIVGPIGKFFKNIMFGLFGLPAYIVPICLFIGIFFGWVNQAHPATKRKLISGTVLFLAADAVSEFMAGRLSEMDGYNLITLYKNSASYCNGGGAFGGTIAYALNALLAFWGSVLVLAVIGIICVVLITEKSFVKGVQRTGRAAAIKAKSGAQNMREYSEERARMRQTQQYEQLRLNEEQLHGKEEAALSDRNTAVRGINFTSIFSKLGDNTEKKAIPSEDTAEFEALSRGSFSVEEQNGSGSDAVLESAARNAVIEPSAQASGKVIQITRETVAKGLPETDELHELRPKTSYHTRERLNLVKEETKQQTPARRDFLREAEEPIPVSRPVIEKEPAAKETPADFMQEITAPVKETRPGARLKDKSVPSNQMSIDMAKLYQFPPVSLLQKGKSISPRDGQKHLEDTARKLQECLRVFGVNVTITDISQGPAVTRYELQPEQGVKVSKIVNLSDDIKLNLAATDIRIEAPIPGKSAIGIEVPNKENSSVAFRELIESNEFKSFPSKIAFAVGKDIGGKIVVSDIAKMPHMLIAGSTGSGKSVCINTLIMSILYKAHPDEVKLIMIDPKVVELSSYNGIPHLLIPVVTDPKQAAGALQWGVSEMMARYEKFAELNVRDMKGYNAKVEEMAAKANSDVPRKLPQIVIIVDELADLMMVAPGEVEEAICRLAQLARAAGIHLIIATQRPSVDVITGLIKANMPSRVAFAVSSGVDSRTILDMNGAEKLLGKGDMLFYPQGYSKPVRVQGSFVSDAEVGAVVDFLKNQQIGNIYQEEIQTQINNLKSGSGNVSGGAASKSDDRDALFADAGRFIIEKEKASIGMLQRVFKIGFNRAARIVDQLCEYGVVGEEEGTKPRKVLMSLEQFENLLEEI